MLTQFNNAYMQWHLIYEILFKIINDLRETIEKTTISYFAFNIVTADDLWPLLLTWFNFNPSMDK